MIFIRTLLLLLLLPILIVTKLMTKIMMAMMMMMMYNSRVMGYSSCQYLQEHKVVHENEPNRELTS
jgi:hypothetical protein